MLAILVNCIFSLDYLDFSASKEVDSLELFAGDCAVSRGEMMDGVAIRCVVSLLFVALGDQSKWSRSDDV